MGHRSSTPPTEPTNSPSSTQVDEYIHIGNNNTHGYEKVACRQHQNHHFKWLLSRAHDQSENHICTWGSA